MPNRRRQDRRERKEKTARGPRKAPARAESARARAFALQDSSVDGLLALLDESPKSRRDGIGLLLSGIAAVELSLARLIHVECEKSEFIARRIDTPFSPQELIDFEKALASVMAELVKKEELLLMKLRVVLAHLAALDRECLEEYGAFGAEKCDEDDCAGDDLDDDLGALDDEI